MPFAKGNLKEVRLQQSADGEGSLYRLRPRLVVGDLLSRGKRLVIAKEEDSVREILYES